MNPLVSDPFVTINNWTTKMKISRIQNATYEKKKKKKNFLVFFKMCLYCMGVQRDDPLLPQRHSVSKTACICSFSTYSCMYVLRQAAHANHLTSQTMPIYNMMPLYSIDYKNQCNIILWVQCGFTSILIYSTLT